MKSCLSSPTRGTFFSPADCGTRPRFISPARGTHGWLISGFCFCWFIPLARGTREIVGEKPRCHPGLSRWRAGNTHIAYSYHRVAGLSRWRGTQANTLNSLNCRLSRWRGEHNPIAGHPLPGLSRWRKTRGQALEYSYGTGLSSPREHTKTIYLF
ncbi:hypothetical protein KCP74_10750 [Salmonella enterica subsp. enterica]|nr:hypothetical protein KCP74_10750 [Salmonella enterica subsp. enterica]